MSPLKRAARGASAALFVLGVVALAATADAEDDRNELDKAKAATLLNGGNALFEKGDYQGALQKYERAFATFASPKIFFNIGEAHNKLGHAYEAAEAYDRFIAEAKVAPDAPAAVKVKERLDGLRPKLAYLEIDGEPEGAAIEIDGKAAGALPLAPVRVRPGPHEVKASHDGYKPTTSSVEARVGATVPVHFALSVLELAVETPPIGGPGDQPKVLAEAEAAPDGPVTSKWWFWGLVGVAAVAAGTAIAVAATSGGGGFTPSGELGSSSTSTWTRH